MKLDSEHLEILAMIVEKGGLTEGADALGKSQPSVSRTMALLEDRIGAPLFEPGKRPLRPTELGESLARIGARIAEVTPYVLELRRRGIKPQDQGRLAPAFSCQDSNSCSSVSLQRNNPALQ